jgi:hypothetical protein
MSDPKRLVDEASEGTAEERELIEAARARRVPAAMKAAVWSAVVAQGAGVVATAEAAAATGAAAKGGALAGLWTWKGIALLAVVGAGAGASVHLLRQGSAPATAPPAHLAPAQPRPAASEGASPTPPPPAATEPPPRAMPRASERGRRAVAVGGEAALPASRLAEEAQRLVAARQLLRTGAVAAALAALAQDNREFAGGRLAQEREALFIEALAQDDQQALARQRAEVFLRNYPGSPHAADVKRHVEGK